MVHANENVVHTDNKALTEHLNCVSQTVIPCFGNIFDVTCRAAFLPEHSVRKLMALKKGFPKWIRSGEKRQLAAEKQWIAWCGRFRMITGISKLDKTTLPENESSSLAYLRDVKEEKLSEQLQFARYIEKNTTGQSIFLVVAEGFKEKGIPLRNLINAVTDGDLEMAY
ncbi:hypothetical protein T08_16650 [Trichinella sp. T8]|nr:hypothetical protein T08_16650 [Trichinella sp. T8]